MKSSYCDSSNCVEVDMFAKSSYSNGGSACVEVGQFETASYSGGNGNCVEVGGDTDGTNHEIVVRDSKQNGNGPTLHYTPAEWLAFIKGVKDGEFDLSPELTVEAEAELAKA